MEAKSGDALLAATASNVTSRFINFKGQSGMITLTPPGVHQQHEKAFLKELSIFRDRGVFHGTDIKQGSRQLGDGIFKGKFVFPERCCVCMEPATRYTIVEILGKREGREPGGAKTRWSISGVDTQTELQRHLNGTFYNRYWYAVPFCDAHTGKSKAVYLNDQENRFEFANREYARLFGEENKIDGRWYKGINWALRGVSLFIAGTGAVVIIGAILFGTGILTMTEGGEDVRPSGSTILLAVAGGAIGAGAGIFIWSKNRGEII